MAVNRPRHIAPRRVSSKSEFVANLKDHRLEGRVQLESGECAEDLAGCGAGGLPVILEPSGEFSTGAAPSIFGASGIRTQFREAVVSRGEIRKRLIGQQIRPVEIRLALPVVAQ